MADTSVNFTLRLPVAVVEEMKAIADSQTMSYADFYRLCIMTGYYQMAEGYNKVLVNRKLRKANEQQG